MRYSGTSNIPTVIVGDALRLRQILTNLIGNAIKFTTEGTITLSISCHHETHCTTPPPDGCVEVTFVIEDTGIGMSRAILDNLFAPFTQADSSTTRRYGGTGLGLAITKRLIDLIGGRLQVESQPNVGSKFTVTLPYRLKAVIAPSKRSFALLATADLTSTEPQLVVEDTLVVPPIDTTPHYGHEQRPSQNGAVREGRAFTAQTNQLRLKSNAESQYIATAPGALPSASPKPILLVEDYPNNQLVALAHLKKLGYDADIAENGQVAIDRLIAHGEQYQLVLMDWQMPVMDGLETTRLIRKMEDDSGQHLPIVGMTANAIKGDRERCLEAGMDDYLAKPIRRSELSRILARWLAPALPSIDSENR